MLYTPATKDLGTLVHLMNGGNKEVRRFTVCTEDSVGDHEVELAIANTRAALEQLDPDSPTEVFIRLRNPEVMKWILDLPRIEQVSGFVIPKADPKTFGEYADAIIDRKNQFSLLPIIEHEDTPDSVFRYDLLQTLRSYRPHIDCVRIGGNDLLGHQSMRRVPSVPIYHTVIGVLIANIVNEFRGVGKFEVTAPVFECFDEVHDDELRAELKLSIANNLYGQTVIHKRHLRIILEAYKVAADEYASAVQMLSSNKAVVGMNGRMDEKATHGNWAQLTVERRAKQFGVRST